MFRSARLLSTSAILTLGLLWSSAAWCRVTQVRPGPGTPLQNAINAAQSGDDIQVLPGIYREVITVAGKSNLRIRATAPGNSALDGAGLEGNGFLVSYSQNITIRGFVVRNFRLGPGGNGVALVRSSGCVISSNHFYNNVHGISLVFADNNEIGSNEAYGHTIVISVGIGVSYSNGNWIHDNFSHDNAFAGFMLSGSAANNRLTNNDSEANGVHGFLLRRNSDLNTLDTNTALGNGQNGIRLEGDLRYPSQTSDYNSVTNNFAASNNTDDLSWDGTGVGNVFSGNSAVTQTSTIP